LIAAGQESTTTKKERKKILSTGSPKPRRKEKKGFRYLLQEPLEESAPCQRGEKKRDEHVLGNGGICNPQKKEKKKGGKKAPGERGLKLKVHKEKKKKEFCQGEKKKTISDWGGVAVALEKKREK